MTLVMRKLLGKRDLQFVKRKLLGKRDKKRNKRNKIKFERLMGIKRNERNKIKFERLIGGVGSGGITTKMITTNNNTSSLAVANGGADVGAGAGVTAMITTTYSTSSLVAAVGSSLLLECLRLVMVNNNRHRRLTMDLCLRLLL